MIKSLKLKVKTQVLHIIRYCLTSCTTIAGYLLDLKTGQEIALKFQPKSSNKIWCRCNIRISFAESIEGLDKLHSEVVDQLNNLIEKAVTQVGYKRSDVYALTIAGNTTMHHLFLKIQPKYLTRTPYVPVVTEQVIIDANDINIRINPAGKVFVFPNIAGFVGGNTVAAALTAEIDKTEKLKLLIDMSTMVRWCLALKKTSFHVLLLQARLLKGRNNMWYEGALGAIDHVSIGEEFNYTVIGDSLPRGIAGSGIVDVVAELLKTGIVNKKGRILRPEEIKIP